jgi:uncharacterized membrane protein
MNDSNRSELNSLRAELNRVELDLRFLRIKAEQLESRISEQENLATQSTVLEPLIYKAVTPPPVPKPIEPPSLPKPVQAPPPIIPDPVFQAKVEPPKPSKPQKRESLEMRLGTYWFVRIGIVMVLTALVFLGNYAYQHYIGLLGPIGKVILMYLTSAGLLAAGAILPRKEEKFRNYGQVLFAGGLAAVYFTTYAAHHFPNLRVIQSAVLDGILLLGWITYIVWLADRKKSEVLAVFAIGLAYYTALITNVGNFTLISNLLLAAAAVFFLVRNRWIALTFLSIAASYGSYFYWRYYAGSTGIEEFAGRLSIAGYWTIFTAAVFLSRHAEFQGPRRAGFLSFNNAAAFALLTASFYHQQTGRFWQLSLAAGAILLALSYLALRFIPKDELPRRAYLAQGLLLVTLGIITKLSGPTLALTLGVESALLLIFSTHWKSRFVRSASIIVATLSGGWLVGTLKAGDPGAWAQGAGVFALLLFNAFWSSKHEPASEPPGSVRPQTTYFTALSLLTWCAATFMLGQPTQIGPILALTALVLTAMHYLLRVGEVTLLAQAMLGVAQGQMLMLLSDKQLGPTWSPTILVVISLGMALWWKRQKTLTMDAAPRQLLEVAFAFAAALITQLYLPQAIHGESVITVSWTLTVAWTALGIFTRSWPIAAGGQLFLIVAWFTRTTAMFGGDRDVSHHSLEILGSLLALAAFANYFRKTRPQIVALQVVTHAYQWAAALLTFAWVTVHIGEPFRFVALVALFAVSLVVALFGFRYAFGPGVFLASAGLLAWMSWDRSEAIEFQNLLAIAIIGAGQFLARKKSDKLQIPESAHHLWIAIVSMAFWLFTSWSVIVRSAGAHFYLTGSWAILAFVLFAIGFVLRERTYRWAALTVLGCALSRVVLLDVWKLQVIYRIFSFFALGIVLLALGYIYTRQAINSNTRSE